MKNIKNIIEQKYPPENPNDLWMKDNVLYKSTHKGWTPLTAGGGSSTNGVTSTTWQELKDKRDAGKLTPGSLYRITDYNCTTTQENTQSAGHQFDIILLALSKDKLAEEGWAMEHPTDVYDVICTDNIIIKCYYYTYYEEEEKINLVNVDTLLGNSGYPEDYEGIINHETKTITAPVDSATLLSGLSQENLPYNYFQNSNLSAWKVWYCLDNDKSRFAWAQEYKEAEFESFEFNNTIYTPSINGATGNQVQVTINGSIYYQYENISVHAQVLASKNSTNIQVGDTLYTRTGPTTISVLGTVEKINATPAQEEGTGVIYRLIDEWNNDVGYDFKNIQFIRPMTDGEYDPEGEDTWVYTFSHYNEDTLIIEDGSISIPDIGATSIYNIVKGQFELNNNVLFDARYCEISCDSRDLTLTLPQSIVTIGCEEIDIIEDSQAIYLHNQKVLTEE